MTPENEAEANAVEPTKSLFGGATGNGNSSADVLPAPEVDTTGQAPELTERPEIIGTVIAEEAADEGRALDEDPVKTVEPTEETVDAPVEVTDEGVPVESVDEPEDAAADTAEAEQPVETVEPTTETAVAETKPKTVKELQAEKEALDNKLSEAQKSEEDIVIDQIAAVVKTYNIPVGKLVKKLGGIPSPRKGSKAPILFKDDKGNKWTGRGRTPKWLADKNIEDYRI